MKLLLDTHAFLWFDGEPNRLSPKVQNLVTSNAHELFLSHVSIWEIQIKSQLGKLALRGSLSKVLDEIQRENQIQFLPIEIEDILNLASLAHYHRDPFDRLLVAQAMRNNMQLISHDPEIANYGISTIWD